MDNREYKVSRMRNWLALLLMALAAMAAGRTRALEHHGGAQPPHGTAAPIASR